LSIIFAPNVTASVGHRSFDEACQAIAHRGEDGQGRVHCLVADYVICKQQEALSGGTLKAIRSDSESDVTLPVAAGVHLEEPQLLHVINTCLETLQDMQWYSSLWRRDDGRELQSILKDAS